MYLTRQPVVPRRNFATQSTQKGSNINQNSTIQQMSQKAGELKDKASQEYPEIVNAASNMKDQAAKKVEEIKDSTNITDKLKETGKEYAKSAASAAATVGSQVMDKAAELGKQAAEKVMQVGHQAVESIKTGEALDKGVKLAQNVTTKAQQIGHQAKEAAKVLAGENVTITDAAKKAGEQAYEKGKEYAQAAANKASEYVDNTQTGHKVVETLKDTNIKEKASNAYAKAARATEDFLDKQTRSSEDLAKDLKGSVNLKSVNEAAQKVADKASTAGQNVMNKVEDMTGMNKDQMKNQVKETVNKTADKAKNIGKQAADMGKVAFQNDKSVVDTTKDMIGNTIPTAEDLRRNEDERKAKETMDDVYKRHSHKSNDYASS